MLSACIVDDEKDSIETLISLIRLYNINLNIIETGHTVSDGINILKNIKPDLIFLDVRLGDEISFSIFEKIKPGKTQVIFISAYDSYAVKAFRYSAIDFLLKPIDADELISAVSKAESNLSGPQFSAKQLEMLMANFKAVQPFMLSVPTSDGLDFIDINHIVYLKAEGSYSDLYLTNRTKMMVSKNIGEFQEQLPEDEFCRVHNSYIINLRHTKKLKRKGGLAAEMQEGKEIPIARNRKESFMEKLQGFVIHK